MTHIGTKREPFFGAPRAETPIPTNDPRLLELFGLIPTAGAVPVTVANAESVAAVWGCVRVVAGSIAMMPVKILRDAAGIRDDAVRDDLWWMLNEEPDPMWTASAMWEMVAKSMLLRGDGFVQILRRGDREGGQIIGLRPHHPDRVMIVEDMEVGAVYDCTDRFGRRFPRITPPDMLHFTGFGFDGVRSPSAIAHHARRAIGGALATDEFAARFFQNGALQKHVIKAPAKMSETAAAELRRQWSDRYAGLDNAFANPIVLTEGLDVKELSLSAEDAQLLASREFSVAEICTAFGVPPILIQRGDKTSSWGTGVEQVIIGFVRFTLAPILKRFRDELNRKLIRRSGRTIEFDTEALTRPDSKAFGELLRQLVGGSQGPGIITVNEARGALNRSRIDNGDELYDPKKGAENDEVTDDEQDPGAEALRASR